MILVFTNLSFAQRGVVNEINYSKFFDSVLPF